MVNALRLRALFAYPKQAETFIRRGKHHFASGDTYEGDVVQGELHGVGTYTWLTEPRGALLALFTPKVGAPRVSPKTRLA